MVTIRGLSGKSDTVTSDTSRVLIEDVLFSVKQDIDTTAMSPPLHVE